MDSSARLTPREEERKESWMKVSETVGSFEGKFGKASGESSATVACEVPYLPKAGLPMCSCCAQSLAGSKPWEVRSGANAGWVSEHNSGNPLLITSPLVEIWGTYFHGHHTDILDNV